MTTRLPSFRSSFSQLCFCGVVFWLPHSHTRDVCLGLGGVSARETSPATSSYRNNSTRGSDRMSALPSYVP
jgi:hypothetical protein